MRKAIIAVFGLGLLAHLAIFGLALGNDQTFFYDDDSAGYLTLAENMQSGNGFSWNTEAPYAPNSFRTPGYPAFLLAHRALFGSSVPALVTQIGLALLIAWLVYRLGARFFSARLGLIATGIFLAMPFSLLVPEQYLTQVLFTALVMGAVWYWLEALGGRWKYAALAGILLALAVLVRPIAQFLPAAFIASAVFASAVRSLSWQKATGMSLILIVLFIAGIAPWAIRNDAVFGRLALSSLVPSQLYFYDGPSIYATAHDVSYDEARVALVERIEAVTHISVSENYESYIQFSPITDTLTAEGKKNALADIPALIETRTLQFFKFFVRDGTRTFLEPYGISYTSGPGLAAALAERTALGILMIGFFTMAIVGVMRKSAATVAMTLVVLYFAALTGVMGAAGFRYPAEPLFILLGVAGIFELYTLLRTRIRV